jgi:hypothetical protein
MINEQRTAEDSKDGLLSRLTGETEKITYEQEVRTPDTSDDLELGISRTRSMGVNNSAVRYGVYTCMRRV